MNFSLGLLKEGTTNFQILPKVGIIEISGCSKSGRGIKSWVAKGSTKILKSNFFSQKVCNRTPGDPNLLSPILIIILSF